MDSLRIARPRKSARLRNAVLTTAALQLACSCRGCGDEPSEVREVWNGTIDGVDLDVQAELRQWRIGQGLDRDLHVTPAYDVQRIFETFTVSGGRPAPSAYWTGEVPVTLSDILQVPGPGRALLASLPVTVCPVPHGLIYQLGARGWTALAVAGHNVFRGPIALTGTTCATATAQTRLYEDWLVVHPGGATACRALDDAGRHDLLPLCYVAAGLYDNSPVEPLPDPASLGSGAHALTQTDFNEIARRIATQPALLARYEDVVTQSPPTGDDPGFIAALAEPFIVAHRGDAFVQRVAQQCGTQGNACSETTLRTASAVLRFSRGGAITPETCATSGRLIAAVRARGGADALRLAFSTAAGMFTCDTPEFRALALDGLSTATSPDETLRSPGYIAYSVFDMNCQRTTMNGVPYVNGMCTSLPRWAGSWLGAHCGPDAVARARAIAAARPREPFDPREDQVLDGALRVLGACDPRAFEAAIAHVPETTLAIADIRSREHLRTAFLGATQ